MKKFFILATLGLAAIISSYSFKSTLSDPNPPTSNTGAPTQSRTCVRCHGDFPVNQPGGSIVATGLPLGSYVPGQAYNFSVTITNASAMQMWGFAIKAVISGTSGTALGTFSTTNPNTNVSGGEIRNSNGAVFSGTSYTFNNLIWTAPLTGSSSVSFYVAGIAADADGSEAGDFSYSNSYLNIVLPVTLGEVKGQLVDNAAIIEWSTYSESGTTNFEIERSFDGRNFEVLKSILSSGGASIIRNYKWIDNNLPKNENILFYRLKITDQNGKTEYSKVVSLKSSVITYVENIFPTLINGNELVKIKMVSNTHQSSTISVFSSTGKNVFQKVQMLNKGANDISLSGITAGGKGVYLVKITAGNYSTTKKIVVQ
jgi:hypothetical protein